MRPHVERPSRRIRGGTQGRCTFTVLFWSPRLPPTPPPTPPPPRLRHSPHTAASGPWLDSRNCAASDPSRSDTHNLSNLSCSLGPLPPRRRHAAPSTLAAVTAVTAPAHTYVRTGRRHDRPIPWDQRPRRQGNMREGGRQAHPIPSVRVERHTQPALQRPIRRLIRPAVHACQAGPSEDRRRVLSILTATTHSLRSATLLRAPQKHPGRTPF